MRGAVQMQITTIGLDIAKNVFQVHGIDANETVVVRKRLRRSQVLAFFKTLPPCLVGMEACATAHYWARELTKLGHRVRLMPAKDVKAYVKRNKNDAADAEAICEAVRRPTMRFVQVKSAAQQSQLMLHRTRDLLMRQRTQVINALRAHMAELGIVAAQGREGTKALLAIIADDGDERLPVDARASLIVLAAQLQAVCTENLVRIDCVTESPNVNGDDRAHLPLPDPVRLAVQVEEPTWGRERGAPSSTDCAAAQVARSRPAH